MYKSPTWCAFSTLEHAIKNFSLIQTKMIYLQSDKDVIDHEIFGHVEDMQRSQPQTQRLTFASQNWFHS